MYRLFALSKNKCAIDSVPVSQSRTSKIKALTISMLLRTLHCKVFFFYKLK